MGHHLPRRNGLHFFGHSRPDNLLPDRAEHHVLAHPHTYHAACGPVSFFFGGIPFLHTYSHEQWIPLLFVISFAYLFRSYESPYAAIPIFHTFLCIGISSFLLPQTLYFIPLIYFYMMGLRAFTLRTFFAGLTGIFTPYWIMLCYHLYTGTPEKSANRSCSFPAFLR